MPAAMDIAAATHLTFILCAPPCDDEPALLARVVQTMRPHFPGAAERALPPDADERFRLRLVVYGDVVAFEGGSALPAAGSPAVVTVGPRGSDWRTHEGEPEDMEILVMAPATPRLVEVAPTVLGDLAATVSARWGFAYVSGVDERPQAADEHVKLGLPELHVDLMDGVAPMALGWLNFWSAAACERLGVPTSGPPLDPQSQQHAEQVAGGWLVSLTREPLDLRNEQHLACLRRAYDRFPEVGGVAEHPRHEQRLRTDPRELYAASVDALVRLLRSEIRVAQLRHLNAPDVIVQQTEAISTARRDRWGDLRALWSTPAMAKSQHSMRARAVDRAWEICRGEYMAEHPDQREVPEHVEAVIEELRGEEIVLEMATARRVAPPEA
jgi:hypothetical protein